MYRANDDEYNVRTLSFRDIYRLDKDFNASL